MRLSFSSSLLLSAGLTVLHSSAQAAEQVIVTSLANTAPPLENGVWYDWATTGTGQASIKNLANEGGGDLEDNQPLGPSAAKLTTLDDDNDRANVGIFNPFLGLTVGDVFPSLNLDYSFYKASNPAGQNLNAAAALKIEIYNPVCTLSGDCYGTLVYEPYVNGFGNTPPVDTWDEADIDPDTGGFWWTGGFGQPSSGGGNPYYSLNEWLSELDSDFAKAFVVSVQIGVGSYNPGQIAYFDNVTISHERGLDVVYNFEDPVDIDIRFGNSKTDHINTKVKQLVPIAILGTTNNFNPATGVDVGTVDVRGASPLAKTRITDMDGDGIDDLVIYFRAGDFDKPTAAECAAADNAELCFTGLTIEGDAVIRGCAPVTWIGPDCKN